MAKYKVIEGYNSVEVGAIVEMDPTDAVHHIEAGRLELYGDESTTMSEDTNKDTNAPENTQPENATPANDSAPAEQTAQPENAPSEAGEQSEAKPE